MLYVKNNSFKVPKCKKNDSEYEGNVIRVKKKKIEKKKEFNMFTEKKIEKQHSSNPTDALHIIHDEYKNAL